MSNPEDSQSDRGFKVQDRRRFNAEGEANPAEAVTESAPPPVTDANLPPPPQPSPQPEINAINFSTFLISLGTQALAYLGEIPNPADGSKTIELAAAKEMIDILAMLGEKTKGNLDEGESHLLESLLYDLRLKYVERFRSQASRR